MAGKNVLGTELQSCSEDPMTGFYRDGCCNTGAEDRGLHTVCVRVNAEFLSSVDPLEMICPHLCRSMHSRQPGDQWCLCAARWKEAYDAGCAPAVILESTHMSTLEFASLEQLQQHHLAGGLATGVCFSGVTRRRRGCRFP